MRNVVILSATLYFFLSNDMKKRDYISIEYSGNSTKLMNVIYISKEPIPNSERTTSYVWSDFPENYLVSTSEFIFIEKLINSTARSTGEGYNGFKIAICENDSTMVNFVTRKNSDALFLKINACLKQNEKNKDLMVSLEALRRMNVFDDNGRPIVPKQ